MGQAWEMQVRLIYCEENKYADALVKRGTHQQHLLTVYNTCPSFVYHCLVKDLAGLESSRLCARRSDNDVVV